MLITRWMYEATIQFNVNTYPRFQLMIEAIGQYGVGMKRLTLHEVRVSNLKKKLTCTKDLMKDHMEEWKKMEVQLCQMDEPIGRRELW